MADLDTLNIQISASTSKADNAIDNLIKHLSKLNTALNDYADSSDYVKGLTNLTSGLANVGQSVNAIDEIKIQSIASSLKDLASAAGKLEGIDVSRALNPLASGLRTLDGISVQADQFSGIKTIAESLGKLGGSYSTSAAQALPQIANGLQMLSGVTVPDGLGSRLIDLSVGVSKLGGKHATSAQNIGKIAEGINQLAFAKMPNTEEIRSLARAISAFGSQNAAKAIENLPAIANAFMDLTATLSAAPVVSKDVIELANSMASLINASKGVGKATTSGARGLDLFGKSARNAKRSTKSLAYMFGKLYASYFLVIRGFRLLGKAIDVSSSLTEVQNVVDTVFGNATDKVQEFADTAIEQFGLTELSAKQFSSRFQAMGTAMGITAEQVGNANDFITKEISGSRYAYTELGDSMADVSVNLTKLTADMASFYNMDYVSVAEDMQAVFTGMTRPLRKYGLDLTEATLKEWALKNGLDADIDAMSQAQKTMLRYQYVMAQTGHVMGDFNKTKNTWANVVRTIGQQFQKLGQLVGEGLINTFKPYLIRFREFMYDLLELTQKGLNAIGKLLGWQIEIETSGVTMDENMEDYADALDDAGDAAKKLKGQLRGIDELNNLTTNNKGKGDDYGSGILGLDGEDEKKFLDGFNVKRYESAIGSWYELGSKISEKIKDGLKGIDWDDVYNSAKYFGSNFAKFLNGLIKPDTFYETGKYIANALNTAVKTALSFGENFDFKNFGVSLAERLNGFFENFDFDDLAHAINVFVQGLYDTLKSFIDTFHWKDAFEKVKEAFKEIDIDTIEIIAGYVAFKNLPILTKALESALGISGGKFVLSVGLVIAVASISFEAGKQLGKSLFKDDADLYNNFKFDGEDGAIEYLKTVDASEVVSALKEMANNGVFEKMNKLLEKFQNIMSGGILNFYDPDEAAKNITTALLGAGKIKLTIEEIKETIKKTVQDSVTKATLGVLAIKKLLSPAEWRKKAQEVVDSIWKAVSDWYNNTVVPFFSSNKWTQLLLGALPPAFRAVFGQTEDIASDSFDTIEADAEDTFSTMSGKLVKSFEDAETKIKPILSNIGKALSDGSGGKIKGGLSISAFANGGFPQTGSLFLAGESGTELMGTIGGKTAVASNGEITGISDTIRQTSATEIELLRQQNQLLQGILQKEFGITKDEVFRSVRSSARDYEYRTGSPAFG